MKEEKTSASSLLDDVTDIIESVIFSVFIVLLIFTYLFRLSDVSGPSMEPTLKEDDRVVISPLFYTPEQDDIIIVDSSKLDKTLSYTFAKIENIDVLVVDEFFPQELRQEFKRKGVRVI